MEILLGCISLLQVSVYLFSDFKKIRYIKTIVFLLILSFYFFLLPQLYFKDLPHDGKPVCGMPYVAMTFASWVFGGGLTILTHLVYNLIRILIIKRK